MRPVALVLVLGGCAAQQAASPPAGSSSIFAPPVQSETVRYGADLGGVSSSPVLVRDGTVVDPRQAGIAPASTAARLSLDVVDADLHNVLRLFSHVSGLNLAVADGVQARVTVRLVDVPWDLALQAILHSKGLTTRVISEGVVLVEPIGA